MSLLIDPAHVDRLFTSVNTYSYQLPQIKLAANKLHHGDFATEVIALFVPKGAE